MSGAQPLSLNVRLLLAASVALIAFLGATALALDAAFRDSAADAARDRLQGHVYTLLAAADIDADGGLFLPEAIPEARFSRPASGLYAQVSGDDFIWQSPSMLGGVRQLPAAPLEPGADRFEGPAAVGAEELFLLALGVAWELEDGSERRFTFVAAESSDAYDTQIRRFRRSLWGFLGLVAVVLLAVQGSILRWGLAPLRSIAGELRRVEAGDQERISGRYPRELEGLARNLNAFITSERRNLERFRNSLADLAHSLKTPLAVIRSNLESSRVDVETQHAIEEQVGRMDDIVAYQLRRGSTSGTRVFAPPVPVEDCLQAVVRSLLKLHADSGIDCQLDVAPDLSFHGDRGDLMEIIGNVAENAFKWANGQVLIRARPVEGSGSGHPGLALSVEDDGDGIDDHQIAEVLKRGVRADEKVQGHGIGLAMVVEIMTAYAGQVSIERSELGGARVRLEFPPQSALQ
jgi:two-component system sensor histidine kinase PhoQ